MKAPVLAIAIPRHHDDGGGDDGDTHDDGGDYEELSSEVDDKFGKGSADLLHAFIKACMAEEGHDDGGEY